MAKVWINRVRLPILLVVSSTGKVNISLSAFAREDLVSRDGFGSPVPRQPAHLHAQAESGAYFRNSFRVPRRLHLFLLNPHTPSGQSRVYRVTQLLTDGIHCRVSAVTGPVNLVVPNESAALAQVTMDQLICASLSHTHYWYEVGMLKVPALDSAVVLSQEHGGRVCVCVCFLPIHSGHQVHWTYQPGSHRRKVTQDSHPPSFCGACLNFSREKNSAIPFPR